MSHPDPQLEQLGINVIRGLAMDAPMKAKSGHQGTAMALAPLAHVLWTRIMRYDAATPNWPDRDRFVLSAGHASILLYSMLHLTGFGLEKSDLEAFRQWDSLTPGHPEVHHTAGVEVTTGPLGQGLANAVGMAIAEANLRARFGPDLVDHHTFVVAGDGCMQEGISHEAASLAGHLGLGHLIAIYDDNHITIDGVTELSFTDNTPERFRAYGWDVHEIGAVANDPDAIEAGIRAAMAVTDKPSLVVLRSHIAFPSPRFTDSPKAHGNPFDAAEIAATKELLGLPTDEAFTIPEAVLEMYRAAGAVGASTRAAWQGRVAAAPPSNNHDEFIACLDGVGLPGWETALPSFTVGDSVATRAASGACLAAIAPQIPAIISGGADLTDNTNTTLPGVGVFSAATPSGRQIHYGIREHGMGAAMNGMALHGGIVPVGGTFFVFADYLRPAIRLAALSRAKVVFVFTHDSVGVGEDGPTHQPVEHLASLRAIPDLHVVRPADGNETAEAWRLAIQHDGPTALVLSRQNLPVLAGTGSSASPGAFAKGAYILHEPDVSAQVVLAATGSEVSLCIEAALALALRSIAARVVSFPCWERFETQPESYRASVFPPGVPVLSVEAGVTFGWERWADATIGINRFGASAPGAVVLDRLGMNVGNVVDQATMIATASTPPPTSAPTPEGVPS